MRFPINLTSTKRCPVCKKPAPETKPLDTSRPEAATLTFTVMSHVHGRSYPVFLGSHLMLGWDSGISKHPLSRSSLGVAFFAAKKNGKTPDVGQMEIEFCSVSCLRRFLNAAVDELERRIEVVKPAVKKAKR